MNGEETCSYIEGMYEIIDLNLKGIKDWITKEEPDFALKQVKNLEKILDILKSYTLNHERIINKLINQKVKGA